MSFKDFQLGDKIENQVSIVAQPMWSSDVGTLTTFFTGSVQDSNTGKYYYDVHSSDDQTTDVQFSVTYGHISGYGSEGGTVSGETNPTKAIYSQLRQVLLPAQTTQFNFSGGGTTNYYSDDVFAIVANRARYREKMDPGNWELYLASGSFTASFIDDSGASANPTVAESKREFNVVSGSIADGIYETAADTAAIPTGKLSSPTSGSYGLFYPEMGMIILNPSAIASGSGHNTQGRAVVSPVGISTTINDYNHRKLFNSIKSGSHFASRREERKRSSFYFCRVPNNEFNHSQNPSFFSGDDAVLVHSSFITEPNTYITTIGLYNNNNELLAVAKLSKPFKKDPNTEALIKVRLDY